MRIGILGSGGVGQALATGWARHGHETRVGTRDASKPELAELTTGTAAEVAAWGEVIALAVHGEAAEALVASVAAAIGSKVLIDATNPLEFSTGVPRLSISGEDSLGERVQRAAPKARVVKAYNIVGAPYMVDPDLPGGPPTMLIAGEDAAAKQDVTALLESTGWDVADLGSITASRQLEQLAMVWIAYGVANGTWQHAFRLLRS